MTTPVPDDVRVSAPIVPAWRKKELIALVDLSTSMSWEAAAPTPGAKTISRQDLVKEALPAFVSTLEALDSEAAAEQAGGDDEKGGLLIHGFASEHTELGDFNSSNMKRRLASIPWGGGTVIMPAWKAALADFNEEFGDETEPPVLLTLVLTDGEATDADEFAKVLGASDPNRYFGVAILGYGPDHDKTLKSYQDVAAANPKHVVVVSFDSVTDPHILASDLATMAGLNAG